MKDVNAVGPSEGQHCADAAMEEEKKICWAGK